jgi:hypothetical protein
MNILFAIVAGFPMGYFIKRRSLAVVAFLAADSFLFTYQTLAVLLGWMSGESGLGGAKAFGEFPTAIPITFEQSELFGYGVVNLVILLAGIGLTVLGGWVRSRRATRKQVLSVG